MSEIRIGDKYKWDRLIARVVHISDSHMAYELENGEVIGRSHRYFLEDYTKIEPEREKIELFLCVDNLFNARWLDKDFKRPCKGDKEWLSANIHAQRVKPEQSIFIYADTFEVVGE